jgi:hypothetical protein
MCNLRTLWDISDESFRSMLETQLGRRHAALPGEDVTPDEIAMPMPGDDLIPVPDRVQMRAINIEAPAHDVWPWLAQMMRGAGIYGWPRLESAACASAEHLISDIPPPRTGDRVGEVFEVIEVVPFRAIAWRSYHSISVLGLTLREMTLSYQISARGHSCSRLVVRQRCQLDHCANRLTRRFSNLIHFLLPCSQLWRIKELAEAASRDREESDPQANGQPHQAAPFLASSSTPSE